MIRGLLADEENRDKWTRTTRGQQGWPTTNNWEEGEGGEENMF